MAKLQLTYHKARRQWRKKKRIDGKDKVFYLGQSGVNKTDDAAYYDALREWRTIESDLKAKEAEEDDQAERAKLIRKYHREHAMVQRIRRLEPDDPGREAAEAITRIGLKREGLDRHPDFILPSDAEKRGPDSIAGQVQRFLASFDTQIKLDARSHARRSSLRSHLDRFNNWPPPGETSPVGNRSIAEVNAALLADYYEHLASQLAEKVIGHYTARDSMAAAKQFIRWAWERELCGLPRNIDSRNLTFQVPASTVEIYEVQEIRDQIEAASDRSKLYILLATNCGMTQVDMAKLRLDEVDLKVGIITRKRSKTHKHESVPIVTYKLWPKTLTLLKQFIATDSELALLTETGNQLVREWTTDDGRPMKVDTIRSAHRRLLQKLTNKRKRDVTENRAKVTKITGSFKWLRTTSANLLEQESQFKPVVQLYLGHAPATVAERHYTRGDQKLLDKAVKWLGEQYGQK